MPDVRMNYDSMEAMAKQFNRAANIMETVRAVADDIAKSLEQGALVGMAGDAFRDAIQAKLIKRVKVLAEKMEQMEGDIDGAVAALRDGVTTAQSRFK